MDEQSRLLCGQVLYWSMPPVIAAALAAGVWRFRHREKSWRPPWLGMLSAAILTTLVFALFPPRIRVQFDETELLSTSVVMHASQANLSVTESIPDGHGSVRVVDFALGRRPPLYPFLVSLLHGVTSPQLQNAFAVNAAALFCLLVLVYAWVAGSLGPLTGLSAQLLLVATPCLVTAATSAGFDLLAAVLLLIVNFAAFDCLEKNHTLAPRLAWFAGAGLLFSYSRHESLPLFLLLAACVLWLLRARGTALRPRVLWPLIIYVPLILPLGCLLLAASPVVLRAVSSPLAQLFTELDSRPLFSAAGALAHALTFARLFFDPRPVGPFSGLANLCAAVALVLLLRRKRTAPLLIPTLSLAGPLVLVLAWFYGDAAQVTATRLFLGVATAGALGPVALRALWGKRVPPAALLIGALLWCGLQLAMLRAHPQRYESDAAVITAKIDRLLDRIAPAPARTLLVSRYAPYLNVRGLIALTPESFERNAKMFRLMKTRRDLDDILLVETAIDTAIAPGTPLMTELHDKSGGEELAVDPDSPYVRISRLKNR